MRTLRDDLGAEVRLPDGPICRVVSLVPSLTEAVAATARDALVGVTDWCTRPGDLQVARVRGTKNPDRAAVADLRPDLVVANQEENREKDVRLLRAAGIPVWVTRIETVAEALTSMRRLLVDACGWPEPSWLRDADAVWRDRSPGVRSAGADGSARPARVVVPVWRDPWMVVGHPTFTADLLARTGREVVVPVGSEGRYPHVDLAAIDDPALADEVLLPDEPYVFTDSDGPEAFERLPTRLVSGRLLTWYGPSLLEAAAVLGTGSAPAVEG